MVVVVVVVVVGKEILMQTKTNTNNNNNDNNNNNNSPGRRPNGVYDRFPLGGFALLYGSLLGSPPDGLLSVQRISVSDPPGEGFLATQKIIKKLTTQFSVCWATFFDFRQFFDEFGAILGQFWYPLGLIFRCFLGIPVLLCFFSHFATKFKKMKKVKSAQNIAPVHRIRVSPG